MYRTIRISTYKKWMVWLGVFGLAFLVIYLLARVAYSHYHVELLPLYERGLKVVRDSALAATIILSIAFFTTLAAMCISAALGALHILKDKEEEDRDTDQQPIRDDWDVTENPTTSPSTPTSRTTAPMRRSRTF